MRVGTTRVVRIARLFILRWGLDLNVGNCVYCGQNEPGLLAKRKMEFEFLMSGKPYLYKFYLITHISTISRDLAPKI